jgi:hypothetical protein
MQASKGHRLLNVGSLTTKPTTSRWLGLARVAESLARASFGVERRWRAHLGFCHQKPRTLTPRVVIRWIRLEEPSPSNAQPLASLVVPRAPSDSASVAAAGSDTLFVTTCMVRLRACLLTQGTRAAADAEQIRTALLTTRNAFDRTSQEPAEVIRWPMLEPRCLRGTRASRTLSHQVLSRQPVEAASVPMMLDHVRSTPYGAEPPMTRDTSGRSVQPTCQRRAPCTRVITRRVDPANECPSHGSGHPLRPIPLLGFFPAPTRRAY